MNIIRFSIHDTSDEFSVVVGGKVVFREWRVGYGDGLNSIQEDAAKAGSYEDDVKSQDFRWR